MVSLACAFRAEGFRASRCRAEDSKACRASFGFRSCSGAEIRAYRLCVCDLNGSADGACSSFFLLSFFVREGGGGGRVSERRRLKLEGGGSGPPRLEGHG